MQVYTDLPHHIYALMLRECWTDTDGPLTEWMEHTPSDRWFLRVEGATYSE